MPEDDYYTQKARHSSGTKSSLEGVFAMGLNYLNRVDDGQVNELNI